MPRRGNVPKREILPDPVYGSVLVTRLINSVMLDGKKGVVLLSLSSSLITNVSPLLRICFFRYW